MAERRQIQKTLGVVSILLAIVFAIIMFYPKTVNPPDPTKTVEMRIGSFFTAIDYSPYIVAKAQGRFEKALGDKVKISYITFESLPTVNESIATDRVDIVFQAEPPALIGNAAGIDVVMAGVSCSLVQEIIVRTDSPIKDIAELQGRKIAVLAGTSSHYGVLETLRVKGVDPKSYTILDMAPPDAKAAFTAGDVDAWAVWPPWVEQETVPGRARALPGGDVFIHSIMAIRRGFAEDHPELMKAALDVLEETKLWLISNPEEAQKIVATELELPIEVVSTAWPKHNWSATIDPVMLKDIQAKADFLKKQGLVEQVVDVTSTFVWKP